MAAITLTIPDNVVNRVLDAIAANNNYQNGGETKTQFAKRKMIDYLKDNVKNYEATTAVNLARKTAVTAVEAEIQIS